MRLKDLLHIKHMKRLTFIWMLAGAIAFGSTNTMLTSCATDDNPVLPEEGTSGTVGGNKFTPTQLINSNIYVAPGVDPDVRQAFDWASKGVIDLSRDTLFTPVYVVNKLTDLSDELMDDIMYQGMMVLLMNPVESEVKAYLDTHDFITLDPEVTDSTWILGFNNDTKILIDKLPQTSDPVANNANRDEKTYIALSGLFAVFAERYNAYSGGAYGGGDDDPKKMENLFASYHFVHVNSYSAHVHYDTTWNEEYYLDGTGSATTLIDVYPIHVYEGQAGAGDYFAVKMNTSVANAGMWKGKGWNRRIGIYIRHCGLWATNFDTQVVPMKDEKTQMSETELQFLASCPPTPGTTTNQKSYEDSKSFSLNVAATGKLEAAEELDGNVLAKAKNAAGLQVQMSMGWNWSHKENYTIQNIEIEDRHAGNSIDWNIKFNDLPHFAWSEDYGFKITESLPYRNTQALNASWMWFDPNAKDESETKPLLIKVTTNPQYEMQTFWTTKADLKSVYYSHAKTEYFKIPRPNNKHAGELVIKNDLKNDAYISDIRVYRKGTNIMVGNFSSTVPNGEEQTLGHYLSDNQTYTVTFKVHNENGTVGLYKYTLDDGVKVKHNSTTKLYARNDFTEEGA